MNKSVISILFSLLSLNIWAQDLSYDTYQLIPAQSQTADRLDTIFTDLGFYSLVDSQHGIPSLGVNQVFFKTETQFVIIKHGVEGKFPLNEFIPTPTGLMYHAEFDNKKLMFYFRGHTPESAQLIIHRLNDKMSFSPLKKLKNALIPEAHAGCEMATGGSILGSNGQEIEKLNAATAWKMLKSCMTGVGQGAWDSTGGMIVDAGEQLWSFVKNPIDYTEKVADKVGTFLVKTKQFITTLVNDPEAAFAQAGRGFSDAWNTIKQSVMAMSTSMKVNFVCSLIGSLGIDAAITALTGGAGSAKIALFMGKLASKFSKMKKLIAVIGKLHFKTLEKLKLGSAKMEKFMKGVMSGKIPDGDLAHLESMMKHNDELSLRTLSCFIR